MRVSAAFNHLMHAEPPELLDATVKGVPAIVIYDLAAKLQVPVQTIGELVGLSRATLNRVKRKKLDLAASDRLVRFTRLWVLAVALWETEEAAREWLTSPAIALGGAVPLEFAATETGARMVEDTLGRIAYGLPL